MTNLTVRRLSGPACRLCLDSGEVLLEAAPATIALTAEAWAAIQADPDLAPQFSTDVPAAPADEE